MKMVGTSGLEPLTPTVSTNRFTGIILNNLGHYIIFSALPAQLAAQFI
jgi:hypothetical protein